ncbi:hypothetical protein ANN_03093 [Periplaneta americana]|uniref:Uncharacterized protein n=1 Tax=Periplaneta americana TaxID=6978 RepID=A0ABQ8U1X3_PERAM|nr:hypothetical protein ANN_03093 [Periplaneta americana]
MTEIGDSDSISCDSGSGDAASGIILVVMMVTIPKVRIYEIVILPVVLYGCETWTLTLKEEQRLRVFEEKVFRKTFGANRDEVTGE